MASIIVSLKGYAECTYQRWHFIIPSSSKKSKSYLCKPGIKRIHSLYYNLAKEFSQRIQAAVPQESEEGAIHKCLTSFIWKKFFTLEHFVNSVQQYHLFVSGAPKQDNNFKMKTLLLDSIYVSKSCEWHLKSLLSALPSWVSILQDIQDQVELPLIVQFSKENLSFLLCNRW